MEAEKQIGRGGPAILYALVLIISALVHAPTLAVPFHFDDFHHIAENQAVMHLKNIPGFFTTPSLFTSRAGGEGMYRPLLMTSHALTYALFGPGPRSAHLFSLLLHLLNTALVLSLLRRWTGRDLAAALGALWWAVAAVQQETVAYASARSTLLAALFMLAALRVSEEKSPPWRGGALAGLCYLLALLSKEIAFVLPLLIFLRDLGPGNLRGRQLRMRWPVYALTGAVAPAYLVLRFILFIEPMGPPYIPRYLYLATQARSFIFYLFKSALPVNLTIIPDVPVAQSLFSAPVPVFAAAALAIIGLGALLLKRAPNAGFGILWFAVCLAPTSTVVPLVLIASVERAYLPLLGLIVFILDLAERLFNQSGKKARIAGAVFILVIICNAALTLHLYSCWRSPTRLMKKAVKMAPGLSAPWLWLGIMEMREQEFGAARRHLLESLSINPDDPLAEQTLARLYLMAGSGKSGIRILERMIKDPTIPEDQKLDAQIRLAAHDIDEGRLERARERAGIVIASQPENYEVYWILGLIAEGEGKIEQAKTYYGRALEIYPEYSDAEMQLGIIAYKEGSPDQARKLLSDVVERGGAWAMAYTYLGLALLGQSRPADARAVFQDAIDTYPDDPYGHFGMGLYSLGQGDLAGALENFSEAVELEPDFSDARLQLAEIYLKQAVVAPSGGGRDRLLEQAARQIRWLEARNMAADLVERWRIISGRTFE